MEQSSPGPPVTEAALLLYGMSSPGPNVTETAVLLSACLS
ncbi:hypothetical protein MAR_037926 [Mya arenaria]|uniref:Uncharacterized protein n=1 Tax=Mya arenaria TaxID=6604 RepID=A0ABY7FRP8_MYAAR|nr:hypothetical protein MAR_037926 [Mya arenaria]